MTTMQAIEQGATPGDVFTEEMLRGFHQRAPLYDRENRFFDEDFEDLKRSGYLKLFLP